MKKMFAYAAAALLVVQPVFAAANPWLGTWKLNRSKSTFTGSTMTVTQQGNTYGYTVGPVKFSMPADGNDHPVVEHITGSMKPTGKNEWLSVSKFDGKEVSRTKLKLSDDGKTLTSDTTGTKPDGSTYSSKTVSNRVGAGSGLAGTWKDNKEESTAKSTMVYSDGGKDTLKMEFPESKETVVAPLDGKQASDQGPEVIDDFKFFYTRASATELKYKATYHGKPMYTGVQTVSADGKVLKDVSWLDAKPAEKTTAIYEKQ